MEPVNRFQEINSASLCSLAGRYGNPIPTWFLALIDCLKFPALHGGGGIQTIMNRMDLDKQNKRNEQDETNRPDEHHEHHAQDEQDDKDGRMTRMDDKIGRMSRMTRLAG
jgi:hypothetical protein